MPVRISAPRRTASAVARPRTDSAAAAIPATQRPARKAAKVDGVGGQATDIVEETADRDAERAGAAGDRRHGVGDRFQRRGRSDRQLV
jgi:hypothetical protein